MTNSAASTSRSPAPASAPPSTPNAPVRFLQVEDPDPFDQLLRDIVRERRNRPLTLTGQFVTEFDGLRRELELVLGQGPILARPPYVLRIK